MSKSWSEIMPPYYDRYMKLVNEEDYILGLKNSLAELEQFVESLPESKENFAYDKDKWTVKEVLIHICDTERIFQYRILAIARGEDKKLAGFDQDRYTANALVDNRSLDSILNELISVRHSTTTLIQSLNENQMRRKGFANGFEAQPVFYAYLLSGHLRHHIEVIKERYL